MSTAPEEKNWYALDKISSTGNLDISFCFTRLYIMETPSNPTPHQPQSSSSYLSRMMAILFAPHVGHQYFFNLINQVILQATNIADASDKQAEHVSTANNTPFYTRAKAPTLETITEEPLEPPTISIPPSPQTLKNKFVNDAEGQPKISTPIKEVVKAAIDQRDIIAAGLDNSALFQAINKLANSELILPEKSSETEDTSLTANLDESYFDFASWGSAFSIFKSSSKSTPTAPKANEKRYFENISAPLITMLVLSDNPQQTVKHLIDFNTRTPLSENMIKQLSSLNNEDLYELNMLLDILYSKANRVGDDAITDFKYMVQYTTADEIEEYIDCLDELDKATLDELKNRLCDYSEELTNLFTY